MVGKLPRQQVEAIKIRLAEEIRDRYSLHVPVAKHLIDVTVTREYRYGSRIVNYTAKAEATGWVADVETDTSELRALHKLHSKLGA